MGEDKSGKFFHRVGCVRIWDIDVVFIDHITPSASGLGNAKAINEAICFFDLLDVNST